jgi:hypothetical protein
MLEILIANFIQVLYFKVYFITTALITINLKINSKTKI